jgi:DNA-binding NtrC family response regulator
MARSRVALVVEDRPWSDTTQRWLSDQAELVTIHRGRHLAADLAGAKADLLILEAVHPSEAGWLLGWLHAQPRLSRMAVILIVPFGPLPGPDRANVAFMEKPVMFEELEKQVHRLLRTKAQTPPPSLRR